MTPALRNAAAGAIALSLLTLPGAAVAVTANVPFAATVLATCTVTVAAPGVMTANSDFTRLDSEESGGSAGRATVVTTGATFSVSVDAPSAFITAPAGGNENVTFAANYEASGATVASGILGTVPTLLNPGVTDVDVDLRATKSAGVFAQGAYASEAVVRCE